MKTETQYMAKKFYTVVRTEQTVAEILVCASSKEEAEEVAQMNHVDQGKDEVEWCDYEAKVIGKMQPIGRIAYTKEGYIEAGGKTVDLELENQ